jgi:uncharacterized protein with HEPN domain
VNVMVDERSHLQKIVRATDDVSRFICGFGYDSFVRDDLVRGAVLYQLVIISLAASFLPAASRGRHPEIDWTSLQGFWDAT